MGLQGGLLLGADLAGNLEVSVSGGDNAPELLNDEFLHLGESRLSESDHAVEHRKEDQTCHLVCIGSC